MRLKVLYSVAALTLVLSSVAYAQENYGSEPETCRTNLSIYTEYVNQKNYHDALPAWRWCFENCPGATRNIYIHGVTIMEYFIANESDPAIQQAYVDTLLMVYDRRMEYYGQREIQLGRKGVALLKYRPDAVEEAKKIFDEAYALSGNNTEFFVLGIYFKTGLALLNQGKLSKDELVELYTKVIDGLNEQLANETKEANIPKIQEAIKTVEDLFATSSAADCATIINIFEPKFIQNPTDVEMAAKIIALLDRGRSDDCKLSDLYLKAAVLLYNNEKTANAALSLAQSFFKRGENANAEQYYLEAINLEQDNLRKADISYELGLLFFANFKNYPKARQYARMAINFNPNHGKAYMLIGRAYAAGSAGCGENAFEQKAVNWVIVDQFIKARNVDPSVAEDANEMIGRYSSRFPTQEEAFWYDIKEGQSYTVGCWIGETTTVRFIK